MRIKKILLSSVLVLSGVLLAHTFLPATVSADSTASGVPATGIELGGFAWSSTIGWISMSCTNLGSCAPGGHDYGVTINASGDMSGYGWSPHVGWVRFGGLSGFPTGPGTDSNNAHVHGTYPNLTMSGWVRVCAAAANPATCSGGAHPSAGGWDGWISLGGSGYSIETNASGVVAGAGTNHYAWGSTVVGWIDFSPVTFGLAPSAPAVTLGASPNPVASAGDTSVLTYTVLNADSCTASNNQGATDWDGGTTVSLSGGTANVTVNSNTTYTLTCTNAAGTNSDSVPVSVNSTPPPPPPPPGPAEVTPIAISLSPCTVTDITPPPATTGLCDPRTATLTVRNDSGRAITPADSFPYQFSHREVNPTNSWSTVDTGTFAGNVPDGDTFDVTGNIPSLPQFGAYEVRGTIDGKHRVTSYALDPFPDTDPAPTPAPTITVGPTVNPYAILTVLTGDAALGVRDVVRSGDNVPVSWFVESPLPLECQILGPGVNHSFSHDPASSLVTDTTVSATHVSSDLTSFATFELRCTPQAFNRFVPPPGLVYVARATVDVIPAVQEL